jgi:hypothetical protein
VSHSARSQDAGTDAASRSRSGASTDTISPRWRGQPGRLEVWYVTASDPVTHNGFWLHQELVSPLSGGAFVHGIATAFPADGAPVVARYGPDPLPPARPVGPLPAAGGVVLDPPALRGRAGPVEWDLRLDDPGMPALFTFPAWAWEREVLPAAQIVPIANAPCTGSIAVDGEPLELTGEARGNLAHIYGHGNAQRWVWLHADLGGGDVLEIVSAVGRSPGFNRLPPLSMVQLRLGGRDWPRDPLLASALFRAELGLPTWTVRGTIGHWRLRVEVTIPAAHAVAVQYGDPDTETVTCTNSVLADADILLERRRGRWETAGHWRLRRCVHAEYGARP